jgi:hypothetical protein
VTVLLTLGLETESKNKRRKKKEKGKQEQLKQYTHVDNVLAMGFAEKEKKYV